MAKSTRNLTCTHFCNKPSLVVLCCCALYRPILCTISIKTQLNDISYFANGNKLTPFAIPVIYLGNDFSVYSASSFQTVAFFLCLDYLIGLGNCNRAEIPINTKIPQHLPRDIVNLVLLGVVALNFNSRWRVIFEQVRKRIGLKYHQGENGNHHDDGHTNRLTPPEPKFLLVLFHNFAPLRLHLKPLYMVKSW